MDKSRWCFKSGRFNKFGKMARWSFTFHMGKRLIWLCPINFCWLSYYKWLLWLAQWLSCSSLTTRFMCKPLKPERSVEENISQNRGFIGYCRTLRPMDILTTTTTTINILQYRAICSRIKVSFLLIDFCSFCNLNTSMFWLAMSSRDFWPADVTHSLTSDLWYKTWDSWTSLNFEMFLNV